VSDAELERVVEFLQAQNTVSDGAAEIAEWEAAVDHQDMDMDDDLFWDAVKIFIETQKASVSLLQRKLRVGYSRAARLVDLMEDRGIISEPDVNRKREILIDMEHLEKLHSRQVL
jgi:S-DNA-T family DNA segregation ATPase FtsK/SpoIIIE